MTQGAKRTVCLRVDCSERAFTWGLCRAHFEEKQVRAAGVQLRDDMDDLRRAAARRAFNAAVGALYRGYRTAPKVGAK